MNEMSTFKKILAYVFLPVTLLIGVIFWLLRANDNLKSTIRQKDYEKDLVDVLVKKEAATKEADSLETDYDKLNDEYQKSKNKT